MVKPLVTFADPEQWVVELVTAGLALRSEDYANATVDVGFPKDTLSKAPLTTYVQVEHELAEDEWFPVAERAQVRFNCWAPKGERPAVKALAALVHGLVLAHDDVSPLTGRSEVIADPTTGYLMVWFTALVNTRATLLTP